MTKPALPAWAAFAEHQEQGQIPRIDVDVDAMYAAFLAEFAANPPKPADFPGGAVTVRNAAVKGAPPTVAIGPMTAEEAVCDPKAPTQYWLECAFQCMKMDLQVAMRSFAFEIRTKDAEKRYALAKHKEGRGVIAATWGKEAKQHFRRLRGFIPS
jgi:hypothetical protein